LNQGAFSGYSSLASPQVLAAASGAERGANTATRAAGTDALSGGPSSSGASPHKNEKRDEQAALRRARRADMAIRVAFVLFLLALWHSVHYVLVTRTQSWSGALFPSPRQVFDWVWDGFGLSYLPGDGVDYVRVPGREAPTSLMDAIRQKPYVNAIGSSLGRLLVGYAIAVSIGFPLGLLVARFSLAEKTIGWMATSLQSLPSICWIPLALLWLGRFGIWPILLVTVLGALFATIISVADGIRNVPPLLARAGRTLGANGVRLYFSVLLPAALPGIVSGLKIGWAFAWRSLMAAELIVNEGGLGYLLELDRDNGDAEGVVSTILVIIVIGLGVQSLVFTPIEKRLQALWGLSGVRE
jgi:NitT/TauT family transport system permease protein